MPVSLHGRKARELHSTHEYGYQVWRTLRDGGSRSDQAFLSSLDACDESVPFRRAEDQGWSQRISGLTYCPVAFGKLSHLDTSVRFGLGRLNPEYRPKSGV